jgi:nitroimidazol reductase NimA-like FMN-containing flavoprotein (pyridoxamine 5'-phosphate oxidase superfamily)
MADASGMAKVKLPKMSEREIEQLIGEQLVCRIAFRGELHPYIYPLQYASLSGELYFHFTDYGEKLSLLENGDQVCVEIEKTETDLSAFRFVILVGTLERVKDEGELSAAMNSMTERGKASLSTNFLAAHGYLPQDGWDSLKEDKLALVYRLANVTSRIGLRSP